MDRLIDWLIVYARVNSDPDTLPRTQNFGVDYIAFSELCPTVPPDFLKLAFTCVSIDPSSRPRYTLQGLNVEKIKSFPSNFFRSFLQIKKRNKGHLFGKPVLWGSLNWFPIHVLDLSHRTWLYIASHEKLAWRRHVC